MKRLWKIVACIAVVSTGVIVALLVLARLLITPERVKALVVPLAESTLGRQISLGEIRIGLLSGIELHDLAVAERQGDSRLLTVEVARLRFQWLPLLAKRVIVDEVLLERPTVQISRDADGTLSIADLLAVAGGQGDSAGHPGEDATGSPLSLLVSEVRVAGGKGIFIDRRVDGAHPVRIELSDLEMKAAGFSLHGDLPLRMNGLLNGAPLAVNGTLRLKEKGGSFSIDLQQLDALPFTPYVWEKLPGKLAALKLDLKAEFDRSSRGTTAVGILTGHGLALQLAAFPTVPIKNGTVRADFDLATHPQRDELEVRRLLVDCNGVRLAASGRLEALSTQPRADLALTVPDLDLSQATAAFPPGLLDKVTALAPSGLLRAEATLAGELAEPKRLLKRAEVTLARVQWSAGGQRPELNGKLSFSGEQLVTDGLSVQLGGNTARLDGTLRNLFDEPMVATLDVTASRFQIEPLLLGGGTAAAATGKAAPAAGEVGPFDLPLQASGTFRVGETAWKGLVIRDFLAGYLLRNNQLSISPMTGKVAGGSFSNTARIDLRQPGLAYSADLALQGGQADTLLSALAPAAAGTVFGTLDLQGSLSGRGTRRETASRTLTGDVMLILADGRLASPALVRGFATFLQLPDLNEIAFSDFRGKARIAGGRAEIDGAIQSSRLKLFPRGTLGLDGNLDLAMDTRLSPELSARIDRRGKVTRYLLDADGWTQVPLLVTGTLNAPRYGLDPKGVQAHATRALQQELQRGLDKLLGKPQPPAEEPAGQPKQQEPPATPRQKPLDEALKQLFGR